MLSNAIKFSKQSGQIKINFTAQGDRLKCSVSDSGIGIPEDELGNIFNMFIQNNKTLTGAGGTGLGLSTSIEIINHHNGLIWAENNPIGELFFILAFP